ncbi:MAG TPA: Trm112 family protein [Chloroflexia bacterium]|nr:Trm112 family protein [Chloroflexia bacterium]
MTTRNEIPQDLLDILVCPLDHAKVHLEGEELICESCGRAYPVRDGIPVMLIEEARQTRDTAGTEGQAQGGA